MIVISGALVLVALVLLIIGVVGPDLTFVYASIAVSLVSLVFLVVGILQRRGESGPAAESAAAPAPQVTPADGVTAVVPSQEARASMRKVVQEPPTAASADEELETGGTVLVVEGRPRYHVEGCRYLSGKSAEAIDVLDAREEGFSPCGVCKPDDALAAAEQAEPVDEQLLDDPATEEIVIDEPVAEVAPVRTAAKRTPTRKAPAKQPPAQKAPARKSPAKKALAPATATKAVKAPAVKAPAVKAPAVKAPGRAAVKAAPAAVKASAAAPVRAGSVVVIPDRDKFHKAQCRFVRDADGTEVMSKTAASRAGYVACGVCKP